MYKNISKKKILRAIGVTIIPRVIFFIIHILWITYRKRYHFIDTPIDKQAIVIGWHSELLLAPKIYRKLRKEQPTSAVISRHFHGELIARVLGFFGIKPLRGSTNRGAKQVLIDAIRAINSGDNILITPDGPRGPRYTIANGAVALSLKAKLPIMAVNYKPSSYWQLGSWDRFVIPKPFSKIDIYHQIINIENMSRDGAKEHIKSKMVQYSLK